MVDTLFISGDEWAGHYEDCERLISENTLLDIMLFDIERFLKRKHYLDKNIMDYDVWRARLSKSEIIDMSSSEIINRINVGCGHTKKLIVTGNLTEEEIGLIAKKSAIDKYGVMLVDATPELLYRNYSLTNPNLVDFIKFKEQHGSQSRTLSTNNVVEYIYRTRVNDDFNKIIADYFGYRNLKLNVCSDTIYQWPVEPRYRVLEHDKYGTRPVHMILGRPKFHSGFDITTDTMTPVVASMGGVVTFSGLDERIFSGQSKWNQRYGNMIEIVDDYGKKQLYAHLREMYIKKGDRVKQNDVIALSGCSGAARIPHVHFEMRKFNTTSGGEKNTINPITLLPNVGVFEQTRPFEEKPYAEIWEKCLENPWGITDAEIPYSDSEELIR